VPPDRVRRRAVAVAVIALVASVVGCSGGSSGDDAAEPDADERAGWRVGSCVRQTAGPETIPPEVSGEERALLELQRQFEAVACSDERAIAEITTAGAELEFAGEPPVDDGCPADTDVAVKVEDFNGLDARIMCARNLQAPHPGDAGAGGGKLMVGDCVWVGGGTVPGANAQVSEMPCGVAGWFATIVAMAPEPGGCPPEALSRITAPHQPSGVLCLAPDGANASGGTMLVLGECMAESPYSADALYPPQPGDCADAMALRIEAVADEAGRCPDGEEPYRTTGYDRPLCLD
jgi:hypothetical protein